MSESHLRPQDIRRLLRPIADRAFERIDAADDVASREVEAAVADAIGEACEAGVRLAWGELGARVIEDLAAHGIRYELPMLDVQRISFDNDEQA